MSTEDSSWKLKLIINKFLYLPLKGDAGCKGELKKKMKEKIKAHNFSHAGSDNLKRCLSKVKDFFCSLFINSFHTLDLLLSLWLFSRRKGVENIRRSGKKVDSKSLLIASKLLRTP